MLIEVINKQYPSGVIERVVEKQLRLGRSDGELYDNAYAVTVNAIDEAEHYTSRFICLTTARVSICSLRPVMYLPFAPVRSVSKVEYYNADDVLCELDSNLYELESDENQTILTLYALPKLTDKVRISRAFITLTGGYDDSNFTADPADLSPRRVPGAIQSAIQMIVGTRMETDGDVLVGRLASKMPISATDLLDRYRILPYGPNI